MPRKKIDTLVDGFWAGVDWIGGVSKRMEKSREEAAERRRRKALGMEPEPRPNRAETARAEAVPDEMGETVGAPKVKKFRIPLPKVKVPSFRRQERAAPKMFKCPSCGHLCRVPALYCEACHEPFLHVSKFLILTLVTVAIGCFFSAEYYRKNLEWPWPIYVFYALIFLIVNSIILRGARALSFTIFCWGLSFMGGGLFVFFFGEGIARDFVLDAIHSFGSFLAAEPISLTVFAGTLLIALMILMIWMSKRYTFAHAYRILFVCLAALTLVSKFIYPRLIAYQPIADSLSFLDPSSTGEILELAAVNIARVLFAEIVVYSMVKSYGEAHRIFAMKKAVPKPKKAGVVRSPMDQLVESLYTVSITLMNGATRFYLQIGHGFKLILLTVRDLARHLADFVWIFSRDLFIPVGSLCLSATALYHLSRNTGEYIAAHEYAAIGRIFVAASALLAGQILFLSGKSRINPLRLLTSHLYLWLWFSPYLLTLFIFISLSLFAVGKVLIRWDANLEYGYRIGPVTLGAFVLTAIALVFAVLKRHREVE